MPPLQQTGTIKNGVLTLYMQTGTLLGGGVGWQLPSDAREALWGPDTSKHPGGCDVWVSKRTVARREGTPRQLAMCMPTLYTCPSVRIPAQVKLDGNMLRKPCPVTFSSQWRVDARGKGPAPWVGKIIHSWCVGRDSRLVLVVSSPASRAEEAQAVPHGEASGAASRSAEAAATSQRVQLEQGAGALREGVQGGPGAAGPAKKGPALRRVPLAAAAKETAGTPQQGDSPPSSPPDSSSKAGFSRQPSATTAPAAVQPGATQCTPACLDAPSEAPRAAAGPSSSAAAAQLEAALCPGRPQRAAAKAAIAAIEQQVGGSEGDSPPGRGGSLYSPMAPSKPSPAPSPVAEAAQPIAAAAQPVAAGRKRGRVSSGGTPGSAARGVTAEAPPASAGELAGGAAMNEGGSRKAADVPAGGRLAPKGFEVYPQVGWEPPALRAPTDNILGGDMLRAYRRSSLQAKCAIGSLRLPMPLRTALWGCSGKPPSSAVLLHVRTGQRGRLALWSGDVQSCSHAGLSLVRSAGLLERHAASSDLAGQLWRQVAHAVD
jgi:hypothetical protein